MKHNLANNVIPAKAGIKRSLIPLPTGRQALCAGMTSVGQKCPN